MTLSEKYRPGTWPEVIGQTKIVKLCKRVDMHGRGVYITGGSGMGKTTIARILSAEIAGSVYSINELTGRQLTVSYLQAWRLDCSLRPLYGTGYALIVNESHGMSRPVVEVLLDVLESLPDYAVVIFTTTREGADLFEDTAFDVVPFRSRCLQLRLAARNVTEPLAVRCMEIADIEGLNGKPKPAYVQLLRECRNNMREALTRIEQGDMLG